MRLRMTLRSITGSPARCTGGWIDKGSRSMPEWTRILELGGGAIVVVAALADVLRDDPGAWPRRRPA